MHTTLNPMPSRNVAMITPKPGAFRCASIVFPLALLASSSAPGDVIELVDGRRFEGEVMTLEDGSVRIEVLLGGRKAALTVGREKVKTMEERPLPAGFFDPPPAEPRLSDPKKLRRDQTLYLEVPVIGELGKQVFAEGLAPVLSYAKRNSIQHLVFHIDSEGGDLDEAVEIYRLLRASREQLQYHAIVRKCGGAPLAIAFWCKPLLVLPGGTIGGLSADASAGSSPDDAEQLAIVRARMAYKVVADTGRSGPAAEIIRALIDPSEELAAWRDEDGTIRTAVEPPANVPADRRIFTVGKGQVLDLTQEQTARLGIPPFNGDAKDLGQVLKLPGWTPESDYGRRTMEKVTAEKERKAKAAQTAYETKVKKNTSRREETEKYIDDSLKQAASWDPTKGNYETYSTYWNWGWGWQGGESTVWTRESQKKWRTRSDATLYYLKNAAKGLVAMKKLDAEAVKLDLEPTFKKGEGDAMLRDIEVKYSALAQHKDKTGE